MIDKKFQLKNDKEKKITIIKWGLKLKNKYLEQNIYSNQKFEDQIWYNYQII